MIFKVFLYLKDISVMTNMMAGERQRSMRGNIGKIYMMDMAYFAQMTFITRDFLGRVCIVEKEFCFQVKMLKLL